MEERIGRFAAVVEANPANELARFSLAKALFDEGFFDESIPHFCQLLTAKPDWMVAQILLGKSYLALGQTGDAKLSFLIAKNLAETQHHDGPFLELERMLEDLD